MSESSGGGKKILRGLIIATVIVASIVLLAAFRRDVGHGGSATWRFITDHFPNDTNQRAAVIAYLIAAVILSVIFSKAGHFTAYGIAMGLGPLLWFLFWEGFPPLSLSPSWTESLGLAHLGPGDVILWAVVADVVITVVFVPLELREKFGKRKSPAASAG